MIDLENIIGFIIFLVVAGSSIVSKILEQRKADAERQQRRKVDPSELPEATRRMLYGETGAPPREGQAPGHDIPTARRKGAGAPPMPQRRSAQQGMPPMPQRQEPPARLPELSPQGLPPAEPNSDEERRVRELRRRLQQQMEAQRKQAEFARQKAERDRILKQQQRQQAAAKTTRRPPVPAAAAVQGEQEGPTAPIPVSKPEPVQRPAAAVRRMTPQDVRRLLENPASLRQGIVLMEILQPPVSLR